MSIRRSLRDISLGEIQYDADDSFVLTRMACRVSHLLREWRILHPAASERQPSITYHLEDEHLWHRAVIYADPARLPMAQLAFVGFVGKRQPDLTPALHAEITAIDQQLIGELVHHPALLTYSSLELLDGNWLNLVIFGAEEAKTALAASSIHQHAAHQFAPRYYQWTRIHHGRLHGTWDAPRLAIQRTKRYTFHGPCQRPTIEEVVHGPTLLTIAPASA